MHTSQSLRASSNFCLCFILQNMIPIFQMTSRPQGVLHMGARVLEPNGAEKGET